MVAQLRAQYHLDEPFWMQYLRYLGGILRGDFGALVLRCCRSVTFWRRHFR